MSVPKMITLRAEDLYSHQRFNDGDLLNEIMYKTGNYWHKENHTVLIVLVQELLLPLLPVPVETCIRWGAHNPIRATVRSINRANEGISVDITEDEVIAVAIRLFGAK